MKSLMDMIQSALKDRVLTKTELIEALSNEADLTARKPQEVVEVFLIRFKYPYKQGMGIKHAAKTLE
jgi:nucleoid DNA-binding protein